MLYGMAIGDALGMPSELWSRRKVKDYFGEITEFLDGPKENDVACNFTKGQFTDDTSQALLILDALKETKFVPKEEIIANKLLEWANRTKAFDNNILGPSSKAALFAIKSGENKKLITDKALTNGASMRIAPIGALFHPKQKQDLAEYVYHVSKVTHSSDVAVGGAAMIAYAVSAAIFDKPWDEIINGSIDIYHVAKQRGAETFTASMPERLRLAVHFADSHKGNQEAFCQRIYDVIGCGTTTSESVPAAIAIAYYARNVKDCALLCANIGGDTDTIGAMATAICGAKEGFEKINRHWVEMINSENDINLTYYAKLLRANKFYAKGE